jgi:hypothetical protein
MLASIMYKEGQNGMWVYCKSNTATAMYKIEGLHALASCNRVTVNTKFSFKPRKSIDHSYSKDI